MAVIEFTHSNGSGTIAGVAPAAALSQIAAILQLPQNLGISSRWTIHLPETVAAPGPLIVSAPFPPGDHVVRFVGEAATAYRTTFLLPVGITAPIRVEQRGWRLEFARIRFDLIPGLAYGPLLASAQNDARLRFDTCEFVRTSGSPGLRFAEASLGGGLELENCLIENCAVGVATTGSGLLEVRDTAFVSCDVGVEAIEQHDLRIANSVFQGCGTGVIQYAEDTTHPDHRIEDSRFEDCRLGVDLRYQDKPRGRVRLPGPARYHYLRTEFTAPANWEYASGRGWHLTTTDAHRPAGLRVRFDAAPRRPRAVGQGADGAGGLEPAPVPRQPDFREPSDGGVAIFQAENDPRSEDSAVLVASCVFHRLETGVEVEPGATGRVWLDHNTFALNAGQSVLIRGDSADWMRGGLTDVEGVAWRVPALLITSNVFLGSPVSPKFGDFPHHLFGGIEFDRFWPEGFFPADPVSEPQRNPILIAHNLMRGFTFGRPGPGNPPNRIYCRVNGAFFSRFSEGDHQHTGPWENPLQGTNPVFARLAGAPDQGGVYDWDYHPIATLGSDAVTRPLAPLIADLVSGWGYPAPARIGYYGNEPIVPGVADPPRQAIGAAEPPGWVEYPIYAQNIGADVGTQTTTVDATTAEVLDVVTFPAGIVGVPLGQPVTTLTGVPALDARSLFQWERLVLLADAAVTFGLKVTASAGMLRRARELVRLPNPQHTLFQLPGTYTDLQLNLSFSPWYLRLWRQAFVAFAEQILEDPTLRHAVAWWWMPEELRMNAFGTAPPGSGGAVWEYAAALLLAGDLRALDVRKPIFSYQSESASNYGSSLVGSLAGGATFPYLAPGAVVPVTNPVVPDPDAAVVIGFETGQAVALWPTRFNNGVVSSDFVPLSVGRPNPQGQTLLTVPPAAGTSQLQVGYHNDDPPNNPYQISPPLDVSGFRVAHLDGIFPGNYVDRDLFDQASSGPNQVPPFAPDLTQNRIVALHRARSIREARDNAEYLAGPFWQTAAHSKTHHMVELFANNGLGGATEGRLWPETAEFAAHDLLIGLPEHDGVGLYNPDYIEVGPRPNGESWMGMSGTDLGFASGIHPGWEGYEAVLKLIKTELREFLVCGERDFDLGFEVTSPALAADQIIPSSEYGFRTGWVGGV